MPTHHYYCPPLHKLATASSKDDDAEEMSLYLGQEVLMVMEAGNFPVKNIAVDRWLGMLEMLCTQQKQTIIVLCLFRVTVIGDVRDVNLVESLIHWLHPLRGCNHSKSSNTLLHDS